MILFAQTTPPEVEEVKEAGLRLIDKVSDYADRVSSGDYMGLIVGGCFLAVIIVGSGAFASSIAESRIRGRNFHFFLGMALPVAYPIAVFFILPRKEIHEKKEVKEMRHLSRDENEVEDAFDLESALNYDYFHAAMFDDSGNPKGPFIMTVDSVELRVERIAEVLPTIVVLETVNSDGKLQTMRLPFGRISSSREI